MNMFRKRNKEDKQVVWAGIIIIGGIFLGLLFKNGFDTYNLRQGLQSISRIALITTPMFILLWAGFVFFINKRRVVLGEWMTLFVLLAILALAYIFNNYSDVVKNRIVLLGFILMGWIIILKLIVMFAPELFRKKTKKKKKKR